MENWKIIKEFPNYEVSDLGNVRNLKTKKILQGTDHEGYIRLSIRKDNKKYWRFAHILVAVEHVENIEGNPIVDHINRIKTDNRKENLRWANKKENARNSKKRLNCSSEYKGVCFNKKGNKWYSELTIDRKAGKRLFIGSYDSEEEAGRAYDLKALEHFGQFAVLNFPVDNYL